MILKNQLRLVRLDKFIAKYDPYLHNIIISSDKFIREKFENCFVSSWTKLEDANISIWKLLSNLDDGVRIGIDTDKIFNDQKFFEIERYLPISEWGGGAFFQTKVIDKRVLCKEVKYFTYEQLEHIFQCNEENVPYDEYKRCWQLKNQAVDITSNFLASLDEVRLQLKFDPIQPPTKKKELEQFNREIKQDSLREITAIDVVLPNDFFDNCEILVSPNFSEENFAMLKSFLTEQSIILIRT